MSNFERAFDDVEKAATSTLEAKKELEKQAKALQKAAKDGDINAIKKFRSRLDTALGSLKQTVANAVDAWPFKEEEEEEYLKKDYANELRTTAAEKGVTIHESHETDDTLISHPSIVKVWPKDRAVRIDRKKVVTLRPSRLTEILKENQKKPRPFKSAVFLEALYERYSISAKAEPQRLDDHGPVIPLARIYEAFTSLPGSKREYSKTDFAKALYDLEAQRLLDTKSGARVSFPSSTGTKKSKDTFPFVTPNGEVITYYGIQFSGGK